METKKERLKQLLRKLAQNNSSHTTKAALHAFCNCCEEIIAEYETIFPVECGQLKTIAEMGRNGHCSLAVCTGQAYQTVCQMMERFDGVYKPPKIFISHATSDAALVEKLVTMLEQIGVKQSQLFCSSIPGYGVPQGVGDLYQYIRNEMSNDNLFAILMLSANYYKSPVCLNEMGAAWVKQSAYQTMLLPGFAYSEIKGAVNPRDISFRLEDKENRDQALNEFKDRLVQHLGLDEPDCALWERFRNKFTAEVDALAAASTAAETPAPAETAAPAPQSAKAAEAPKRSIGFSDLTDDEKLVLWYVCNAKVRRVKKSALQAWQRANELYEINFDNAFDLLSQQKMGEVKDDALEFDLEVFRQLQQEKNTAPLKACALWHQRLASDTLLRLWEECKLQDADKLFVAYILAEKVTEFGTRWKRDEQVLKIEKWENKGLLKDIVSQNYDACLNLFVQNQLVYESGWTQYGNACAYKLYPSMEKLLWGSRFPYRDELADLMVKHEIELPF